MKNLRRIKSWGLVLTAIWLILTGVFSLLHVTFSGESVVMDLLAIAAGVLILLGR
jgi:hypothetical protein